jgi:hypothetical protein
VSNNPYSPPKALVADPSTEVAQTSPPHEVTVATRFLWYSVAAGAISIVLDLLGTIGRSSFGIPVIPLLAIGVLSWLTYSISRGRNWARIAFLVVFVLGSPVLYLLQRTVIVRAASVVILVLELVALYLLFTGVGARWFRRDKVAGVPAA